MHNDNVNRNSRIPFSNTTDQNEVPYEPKEYSWSESASRVSEAVARVDLDLPQESSSNSIPSSWKNLTQTICLPFDSPPLRTTEEWPIRMQRAEVQEILQAPNLSAEDKAQQLAKLFRPLLDRIILLTALDKNEVEAERNRIFHQMFLQGNISDEELAFFEKNPEIAKESLIEPSRQERISILDSRRDAISNEEIDLVSRERIRKYIQDKVTTIVNEYQAFPEDLALFLVRSAASSVAGEIIKYFGSEDLAVAVIQIFEYHLPQNDEEIMKNDLSYIRLAHEMLDNGFSSEQVYRVTSLISNRKLRSGIYDRIIIHKENCPNSLRSIAATTKSKYDEKKKELALKLLCRNDEDDFRTAIHLIWQICKPEIKWPTIYQAAELIVRRDYNLNIAISIVKLIESSTQRQQYIDKLQEMHVTETTSKNTSDRSKKRKIDEISSGDDFPTPPAIPESQENSPRVETARLFTEEGAAEIEEMMQCLTPGPGRDEMRHNYAIHITERGGIWQGGLDDFDLAMHIASEIDDIGLQGTTLEKMANIVNRRGITG
jgi:hypothetical protein